MPRRRPRTAPTDTDSIDLELEIEDDEIDDLPDEPVVEAEVSPVVEPEPTPDPAPKAAPKPRAKTEQAPAPDNRYPDGASDEVKQAIDIAISCREAIPNGLILGPDEPLRIEGSADNLEVVVSRDVYRIAYPGGSRRPSFMLLYPRGARILKSTLSKM